MLDYRLGFLAEDIDVVVPHQLVNLHIGAIAGAQGHSSVQHEFHIARAAGLLAGQGNLLRDVTGGNQLFRITHIVVLHHEHFHIRTHIRVMINDLL